MYSRCIAHVKQIAPDMKADLQTCARVHCILPPCVSWSTNDIASRPANPGQHSVLFALLGMARNKPVGAAPFGAPIRFLGSALREERRRTESDRLNSVQVPFTSQRPLRDLRRVMARDGIVVAGSAIFILESTPMEFMHNSSFYRAVAIAFPIGLIAITVVSKKRWPATTMAAIYTT